MAKICYCSETKKGLPTLYPLSFKFCPVCGKPLLTVDFSLEQTKQKPRSTIGLVVKHPRRIPGDLKRRKLHLFDTTTEMALCGVVPKKGWKGAVVPVKDAMKYLCRNCTNAFDRRFM